MAAPMAILAKPDEHRGILAMSEAVDAMLEAFRNWARKGSILDFDPHEFYDESWTEE
jgi:hypothetical protein